MKLIIPLLCLYAFCWLAKVSLEEHGYSKADRDEFAVVLEQATADDWLTELERGRR